MGIEGNPWMVWSFNNAVHTFGTWVEANRYEYDDKGKKKDKINKLLETPAPVHKIDLSGGDIKGREIVRVSKG